MTQKFEFKCDIEKVVRQVGKNDAQVVVSVPVQVANEIPLGKVVMTVQTLQSALFGKEDKKTKK